jgi:hypothetical protein
MVQGIPKLWEENISDSKFQRRLSCELASYQESYEAKGEDFLEANILPMTRRVVV